MARVKSSRIRDREHSLSGEKLSLLAVFARPEDEAFGPSGTLAKYAGEGVRVSLVTAARALPGPMTTRTPEYMLTVAGGMVRETSCSCRAAGIQRFCLAQTPGHLTEIPESVLQERLVRLIRELEPQVIVTCPPDSPTDDPEQNLINRLTTQAFARAGNHSVYPHHWNEGLAPYQPLKLYYSVLPKSVIGRLGLTGFKGVPDKVVTTVLDVSPYSELKLKAVYCQRHHVLDYARWLEMTRGLQWNEEHFILAASQIPRRARKERDLFAGLR